MSTKKKIKIAYKFHLQRKSWLTFWPDGSGFGRSSSAHAYLIPFMWAAERINGEGVRYPLPSARASHVQHHSQRHSRLCTRNTQVPTMSPCLSRFTPGTDSTSQNLKCDRSKPEVVIHQRHSLGVLSISLGTIPCPLPWFGTQLAAFLGSVLPTSPSLNSKPLPSPTRPTLSYGRVLRPGSQWVRSASRLALGEVRSLGIWKRTDKLGRFSKDIKDPVARQRDGRKPGFLGKGDLCSSAVALSEGMLRRSPCVQPSCGGWWSLCNKMGGPHLGISSYILSRSNIFRCPFE